MKDENELTEAKSASEIVIKKLKAVNNEGFLAEHFTSIRTALETYKSLKIFFYKYDITTNNDFQNTYSKYYSFRFCSSNFKKKYFEKLESLKSEKKIEADLTKLTKELIDKVTRKDKKDNTNKEVEIYQFSFITKMINLLNDGEYPIDDSMVVEVLEIKKTQAAKTNDDKLNNYIKSYETIRNTYNELLKNEDVKSIITSFRETFDCKLPDTPQIPDMRILDIIIWKLGANSQNNK